MKPSKRRRNSQRPKHPNKKNRAGDKGEERPLFCFYNPNCRLNWGGSGVANTVEGAARRIEVTA